MLAWVVDEKLALRDAGRAKGVCLENVRAGFQKSPVDVADHLRLRERKEVAVVQQIFAGVLEPLAADVGFLHPVGADRRTHRTVNNRNPLLQNLFERMLLCLRHKISQLPEYKG